MHEEEFTMKKMVLGLIFFVVIGVVAFSQKTITITTLGKTYKVFKKYILEQINIHIEIDPLSSEAWLIMESSLYSNGEWSAWNNLLSSPVGRFMSNSELDSMAEKIYKQLNQEINSNSMIGIPVKNKNNQKYWWKNKNISVFSGIVM
jgi:hypothetical protein